MGTHPIFESDFDCLTENILKWVEALPGIGVCAGLYWAGILGKRYADEAGTHKGWFAGGAFMLPFNWSNTGTKKPPLGAFNRYEYQVENHIYGRGMQMALRAHNTEWIHPSIMPKKFVWDAQQQAKAASE